MTGVVFDVLSLQSTTNTGIYTSDIDLSPAKLDIQDEKLAEADGSVIVKTTLGPRVIPASGYMTAADIATLDALIDTFLTGLNKQNQNLDVDWAGSTRRFVATPRNIVLSRPKGLNSAGWSLEFFCANPVGSDTTSSTLLASTVITTAGLSSAITIAGSYRAEPLITLTLTSGTGLTTGKTITITNDTTLRGISVTRDWTAGDVLEIDCLNKTLYVNDTVVTFSGQFPKWEPGNSGIGYLDDFTTRSVTLSATYYRRFL